MTLRILNDFHSDGVFRDESGAIWIPQADATRVLAESLTRAWDEGFDIGANTEEPNTVNPYRKAVTE